MFSINLDSGDISDVKKIESDEFDHTQKIETPQQLERFLLTMRRAEHFTKLLATLTAAPYANVTNGLLMPPSSVWKEKRIYTKIFTEFDIRPQSDGSYEYALQQCFNHKLPAQVVGNIRLEVSAAPDVIDVVGQTKFGGWAPRETFRCKYSSASKQSSSWVSEEIHGWNILSLADQVLVQDQPSDYCISTSDIKFRTRKLISYPVAIHLHYEAICMSPQLKELFDEIVFKKFEITKVNVSSGKSYWTLVLRVNNKMLDRREISATHIDLNGMLVPNDAPVRVNDGLIGISLQ